MGQAIGSQSQPQLAFTYECINLSHISLSLDLQHQNISLKASFLNKTLRTLVKIKLSARAG